MRDESNELAALFAGLAKLEAGHLEALKRRTDSIALPPLTRTDYKWLGRARSPAHELVFRLMTPRQALLIALGAEQRAQAFFGRVLLTASDPALRGLAREMAADEQEHVQLIEHTGEHPRPGGALGTTVRILRERGTHVQAHPDPHRRLGGRREGGDGRHRVRARHRRQDHAVHRGAEYEVPGEGKVMAHQVMSIAEHARAAPGARR